MTELKGITINTATDAEAHIFAEDDAAIFQSIVGRDGVLNIGEKLSATIVSNNLVTIADGVLCINGHFARVQYGDKIQCAIANGQSGANRNDLIVARFKTENNVDTMRIEVVEGMAGTTAADPEIEQEDLYNGGTIRDLPLYRVRIEGLSITGVEQLFEIIPTISELRKEIEELEDKSTRETVLWSTDDAVYTGTLELSDDLFKYKHLVFMEDNKVLFEIPVIQGMTEANDASSFVMGSSTSMVIMASLNVTDIATKSITIRTMYVMHRNSNVANIQIGTVKLNKIIGIQ